MAENQRSFDRMAMVRGLVPSLVVNGLLPYLLYEVLTAHHVPEIKALIATSVFPILWSIGDWLRTRKLDVIAVISLISIVIGIGISLTSSNPTFYLVKESFLNAAVGLVFLLSLLLPRPILFYVGKRFVGSGVKPPPGKGNDLFEWLWRERPSFRTGFRVMTIVWGVGLLVEAAIHVAIALSLPPGTVLAISPILGYGITILLMIWTFRYGASMRRRGEEPPAAESASAGEQ